MSEIKKKEYDYDNILISLENCILPEEKIDETPSMKDGLDRDTENDLRMFGCEVIQVAGLLLRLPQVAMATGQVLLQRFYFSKSMIKHDVEVCAMAAIFLAAKIEESPRRIRDVINVCHHIKQRMLQKSHTPMEYTSELYLNLRNGVIKAERRILKELGFCVHVKHPHKLIITYLQMIDHHHNVTLARTAWNYMNDSLRSDVFVRFSPETIACACIFLAARTTKVNLPQRPAWYELFDATSHNIKEVALTIMCLYSRPRRKISHLEAIIQKIKKTKADKEKVSVAMKEDNKAGSFTPSHNNNDNSNSLSTNPLLNNNDKPNSKPTSRTASPVEKSEKHEKRILSSVVTKNLKDNSDVRKLNNRSKYPSSYSEEDSSDSAAEKSTKKRKRTDKLKKRRSSSESDTERRVSSKVRRSVSPVGDDRRSKSYRDNRDKPKSKEINGQTDKNHSRVRRRSRSRSPVKRRSPSPTSRKDKYYRQREKTHSKDKYSSKSRR